MSYMSEFYEFYDILICLFLCKIIPIKKVISVFLVRTIYRMPNLHKRFKNGFLSLRSPENRPSGINFYLPS